MKLALLTAFVLLSAPLATSAQEEWEGKKILEVQGEGFRLQRFSNFKSLLNARPGQVYTQGKRIQDNRKLNQTGLFNDVWINVTAKKDTLLVTIRVKEYAFIDQVIFRGHSVFKTTELQAALRLTAGGYLNPWHLKLDNKTITDMYISKGYQFFRLEEELKSTPTGVTLIWNIQEGPRVTVEKIHFSGNKSFSDSTLKDKILSRENDALLFIPLGKKPFLEKNLEQDIQRLKLFYSLEGWLDIHTPGPKPRIFLAEVNYNQNKTAVQIRYHIDEGPRYEIQNIRIQGNTIYSEQEIRSWLRLRPGESYSRSIAAKDVQKIRDKYGEKAYIQAQVDAKEVLYRVGHKLDLLINIKENKKVYVGRISIQGNTKTREEVIRRELTRKEFLPGEEYNTISLSRALNHLRRTGWFGKDPRDPRQGISSQDRETDDPSVKDILLNIDEGSTGNVRFAAGYSSSYGIMGIVEFTQRNFDISDLPKSMSDLVNGTGFAGGGQFFQVRYSPAADRQSFSISFREPYFLGYEVGFGVQGYDTETRRESWDEHRTGGSFSLTKNLDPFRLELRLTSFLIKMHDLDSNAPTDVVELEGENLLVSIEPSLIFDTRNSRIFPTSGARIVLTGEYAGQELAGDFDYNKIRFDSDFYYKLFTTESGMTHVLKTQFTFGWAVPRRSKTKVPIFEKFFAGGRGSIRGFEFRGLGPQENGDPIGGNAYVFGSVEYNFPIFVSFLRGAFFYDVANLTNDLDGLTKTHFRDSVGFGLRIMIPQLSNIPITLDFGFPLNYDDEDERETVTFDIGRVF